MTRFSLPAGRRATGLVLAGVLVGGGLVVAAAASAAPPPWQSSANVNNDPNDVGTLAFYNATGTQIYSGSTAQAPFAAYVAGSTATSTSDTAAALYAYLPDSGTNAGAWSGGQLSAASKYPNTTAPGSLASATPLETGTSGDSSLADFITAYPNTSSDADYTGIYELRLRTSGAGSVASTNYDSADIKVTGSTWQVVYPQHFQDSTTSLTVTPSTGLSAGGSVTLAATVTANASGSVKFSEGTTVLGTVALANGSASKSFVIPHAGSTTFSATYVPDSASNYSGSTDSQTATVAKASTKTTATWPTGALHYGTGFSVKATVAATGITPTGKVSVKSGSTTVASATLKAGKATITVPGTALAPGKHSLTVAYAASSDAAASTSAAKSLTIAKATSKTTNSVSPAKVAKTKQAKVSVTVKATGTTPTGGVTVLDGSKKIASGKLAKGKATITLPKLAVGKHSLHAVYAGSGTVAGSKGATVTLTVTK